MSDTASSTQEKPDDLQTESLKSFKSFEELAKPTEPIEILPAKPQEVKNQKTFRKRYPYCLVLHAVLGSLYVGYVFGAFTPIYEFISSYAYGEELPPLVLNFMISLVPLGAAFGALSGGKIAATLGRRTAMIIVDCLSIIATVQTLLPSEYALLAGRLLQGFTLGANTSITPLYIKEVAPSEIAGRLGTFNLLFVGLGILLVPLIGLGMPIGDNVTPDNNYYLIVLGVAGIFPLLRLLFSITLVRFDTPRYLVYKNKETQALAVLSKIYAPTRAQDELALLITEKELVMKKGKITYRELFSVKYRRRLFVGVMMAFFQPFSGIIAIIFFSHQIFSQGVDDPNSHTPTIYIIIMDVIQVLSNILASVVVERFGRRLLALLGFSIVTVLLAAFGIVCLFVSDSPILKFFIWGYMIGYGLSVGPLPPVIIADVLPDVAVGIAILTVWISCFVIGLGFPPIAKSIGIAWGFIIFAAISFIGVLFIIFFVKETKGKNEAEIAALYAPKEKKKYSGVPNQA